MPEIYTIGYGNDRDISRIQQALDEHPNTVLVDVRRYPYSAFRIDFSREGLGYRFGKRYMYYGVIFGNGAKGGNHDARWHLSGLWYVNVLDWPATQPNKESAIEVLINHIVQLKRAFTATNDTPERIPMFFCLGHDYRRCHRTNVAEFAVEHAWQGYDIVHL